jgi:hypothetical protein
LLVTCYTTAMESDTRVSPLETLTWMAEAGSIVMSVCCRKY